MQVGEIADLLQQLALRCLGVPNGLKLVLIDVSCDAVPGHLTQGVGVDYINLNADFVTELGAATV